MSYREVSEIRDGMRIDWDMPIKLKDGLVLRCDIYRPIKQGRYPVILTYGPYGKWLHFEDVYKEQWDRMCQEHPDVPTGSTNKYQCWEVVDPEKWVPDGYACVRVDSRGAGRSPGVIDIWSRREAMDLAECVEWAGVQPWSNGKVGLNGISYYAENSWQAAALQPKHLAAICLWEGAADFYRDMAHHGGIYCTFAKNWQASQIFPLQHGRGNRGYKSRMNGDWVSGPLELTEEELGANRRNFYEDCLAHKLDSDEFWQSRMPDWSKVKVPLFSAANWGGQGLHPRGNYEGFMRAASKQKWLECHGIEHWTHFYTDYGVALQKKFFGHFLKGEKTGWDKQPKVQLQVRHIDKFVERHETQWPLKSTKWTKIFLNPADFSLSPRRQAKKSSVTYKGLGEGVTFLTEPMKQETETHRAYRRQALGLVGDRQRRPVPGGANLLPRHEGDRVPGRARPARRRSHRAGCASRTASSTRSSPCPTGRIIPTTRSRSSSRAKCMRSTSRSGRPALSCPRATASRCRCAARTTIWGGGSTGGLKTLGTAWFGCGPFQHNEPRDRPASVFGGNVTLHAGPGRNAYLLLPVIPARK